MGSHIPRTHSFAFSGFFFVPLRRICLARCVHYPEGLWITSQDKSRGRPPPKAELLLRRRRYRSPAVSRARESLYATREAIGYVLLGSPIAPSPQWADTAPAPWEEAARPMAAAITRPKTDFFALT